MQFFFKNLLLFKLITLIAAVGIPTLIFAQSVSPTSENWQVINNDDHEQMDLQTIEFKGKKAIHLKRHQIAVLKKGNFDNFIIEMDIAGSAMPGLGFRATDLWNYEFFYCRMHASGKQDAIQYLPVFNGAQGWQLYNYPTYEKTAEFKSKEWVHLKMEVFEDKMRVFIGDVQKPNLAIELLHEGQKTGAIFLKTTFSDAYFANVEIKSLTTPIPLEIAKKQGMYLSNWETAPQIEGNISTQGAFYDKLNKARKAGFWKRVKADKNGIVNLAKYFEVPQQSAILKTVIESTSEKTVDLLFDYSQTMVIALNGTILFYGKELDTHNFMRVMDGEESLSLPLEKGKNELVFMIRSDDEWQEGVGNPTYLGRMQAMNWGFIAKLSDYEGIELMK